MNVAVLCGGQGTRLGYDGQKCCYPMPDGRPFLLHRLDQLTRNGATHIHLLVSHRAEDVFSALGGWNTVPVNIIYDDGSGPWKAVSRATQFIPATKFWVANGDTYFDYPLTDPRITPAMVTTTALTEPANHNGCLDAGLYFVSKANPTPTQWHYLTTDTRTYTLNTPAQLEELLAHLR